MVYYFNTQKVEVKNKTITYTPTTIAFHVDLWDYIRLALSPYKLHGALLAFIIGGMVYVGLGLVSLPLLLIAHLATIVVGFVLGAILDRLNIPIRIFSGFPQYIELQEGNQKAVMQVVSEINAMGRIEEWNIED